MTDRDYVNAASLATLRVIEHLLYDVQPGVDRDAEFEQVKMSIVRIVWSLRETLERTVFEPDRRISKLGLADRQWAEAALAYFRQHPDEFADLKREDTEDT